MIKNILQKFKNNWANRRALNKKQKSNFDVTLKPGVVRTKENMEALKQVQDHAESLLLQHQNNVAIYEIVQDVASGALTEEQAKGLISKFTTNVG